jgi:LSD1 subclass zinc finger protein
MSINKQSCQNLISLYRGAQNIRDSRERTPNASLATDNRLNVAIRLRITETELLVQRLWVDEASRQGRFY